MDGCCDTCFTNGVNVIKSIQTHPPLSWTAKEAARGFRRRKKGIDGNKRIKGIKRHIAVDSDGLPLEAFVTPANVHDSRAAYPLIAMVAANYPSVKLAKADNGYRGAIVHTVKKLA